MLNYVETNQDSTWHLLISKYQIRVHGSFGVKYQTAIDLRLSKLLVVLFRALIINNSNTPNI